MKSAASFALVLAVAACSSPTTPPRDQLNLDRPVDVAFACYGGMRVTNGAVADPGQPVIDSAMPGTACEIRSRAASDDPNLSNIPPGQELLGLGNDPVTVEGFAFVVQSVPGTVGIARFPNKPASEYQGGEVTVIDSDSLTPGKNGITVGSLPVAIATDKLGCQVATANAGSCDLSVLDINSILSASPSPIVNRVAVTNAAGTATILAKPAAMIAEPATGTIGAECPATPGGLFFVAYPGCHLVAAVDGTGHIVQGIQFDPAGVATIVDGDVSCPAECGDMRDSPTPGPRPVTLSMVVDPRSGARRIAIGAENLASVTVVDLDAADAFTAVSQVALTGDVGVLDVAISPEIGMGGSLGSRNDDTAIGGQFQFVYAVTTDGTVRVADILHQNRECDTQIDPRYIHDENNVGLLSCLPLGDPTMPRRATAIGPGIQLTGDAVPNAVTIFGVDRVDPSASASPSLLVGYFAAIGSSGGAVTFVNIDDDFYQDSERSSAPLDVSLPLAIAHQIRDSIPVRDLRATTVDAQNNTVTLCDTQGPQFDDPNADAGGPRLADDPVRFLNTSFIAPGKAFELPTIRAVLCEGEDMTMAVSELGFAAPDDVREAAYPDLRTLRKDETWSLVWEGSVSRDTDTTDVDGPSVRIGVVKVDGNGMRVEDASHPYCGMGIEPHDVVALRGCDPTVGSAQCPTGFTCYVHPDAQVASGSCLPDGQIDTLSGPCRDFLISARRFSVASAQSGVLKLLERPRVLRTTPITGCDPALANQCNDLAVVEKRLASDLEPGVDTTAADPRTWSCRPDPTRNGGVDRCVMTCDPAGDDSDCDPGTVCNASGVCVEGVVPPLQCVTAPQRYEVRVSDAFAVVGTIDGFQHSIIEDPTTHACIKDPAANPLMVGRIPLTAPPCSGDGLTDVTPNPCQVTVDHTYLEQRYMPGTCDPAAPSSELVTVPTTAIRFRNPQMTYHLVAPTYPGDAVCKGDRAGGLGEIPTVFPGMTIQFRQVDGLVPDNVGVAAVFPVRMVMGPQNSLWVIDEGDFLSTSAATASTRGKVFRVESVSTSTINTLQ